MRIRIQPPIHPGEILKEDYLVPLNLSAGALARRLNVPRTRIERIVARTHPITTNTALRLARFFDTTPDYWMNLQMAYDLTQEAEAIGKELDAIGRLSAA